MPQQPNGVDSQQGLVSQQWAGPLPPPGALAQFDTIIPNGAERIMAMVEREQQHRIDQEAAIIQAIVRSKSSGK